MGVVFRRRSVMCCAVVFSLETGERCVMCVRGEHQRPVLVPSVYVPGTSPVEESESVKYGLEIKNYFSLCVFRRRCATDTTLLVGVVRLDKRGEADKHAHGGGVQHRLRARARSHPEADPRGPLRLVGARADRHRPPGWPMLPPHEPGLGDPQLAHLRVFALVVFRPCNLDQVLGSYIDHYR